MSQTSKRTRIVVTCGMLIAIALALKIVSTMLPLPSVVRISLAPAVIMFAGALLGPVAGGICGACVDLLSCAIFPVGPYFPGFTLSMALFGVLFALFYYKRPFGSFWKLALVVLLVQGVCSLFLNTMFNAFLTGQSFWMILPVRLPTIVIGYVFYLLLLFALMKNRARIAPWIGSAHPA